MNHGRRYISPSGAGGTESPHRARWKTAYAPPCVSRQVLLSIRDPKTAPAVPVTADGDKLQSRADGRGVGRTGFPDALSATRQQAENANDMGAGKMLLFQEEADNTNALFCATIWGRNLTACKRHYRCSSVPQRKTADNL